MADWNIPVVANQGGQILAGGISSAAGSLAQGIVNYKQLQAGGKAADAFYKFMDEGADDQHPNPLGPPEQWNTMSARDKMSVAQMMMSGQASAGESRLRGAQAQEAQARAGFYGSESDAADAFGALAPAVQDWQAKNPGKTPGPLDVVGMMQGVKMSPRAQGTVMAKLIPAMMNGENGVSPQAYTSPHGNPYLFMPGSRELVPDRPAPESAVQSILDEDGNELGKGTINPKTGAIQILQRTNQPKQLPQAFMSSLYGSGDPTRPGLADQLTQAQADSQRTDDELKALYKTGIPGGSGDAFRKSATQRAKTVQGQIKNLFDVHRSENYGSPDTWSNLYQQFNLAAPSGTPAAPRGAGTAASASSSDRVTVTKDGKKFTLPKAQLDAAKKQGYAEAGD